MAKISEFRQREVVDVATGRRLGYICDMEIDSETGKIVSVSVPSGKLFSSMMKNSDTVILWEKIIKIGKDIILVDLR
jgi:YlmC/YmxH family sporulation protein